MWNKEDRAFKQLINKEITDSQNKYWFNELGSPASINTHIDEVWTDPIPYNDPAQAVLNGVAEQKSLFVLTEDVTVLNHQSWKAENPPGTRVRDWVSDRFGSSYSIHVFDNTGSEIYITDPVGWFFDYQTGILTFNGDVTSKPRPFKVSGYRYIGVKGGVGGASKIYSTEAALLSDTQLDGVIGYAQDTDNTWYRRGGYWDRKSSNVSVSRAITPTIIYVDGATGDDSAGNDGTVTPLRTLGTLFKRLQANTSGVGADVAGVPSVRVIIKSGDYEYPSASDPVNTYITLPDPVEITGESEEVTNFQITSFPNAVKVAKDVLTPAWTTDEHVGRFLVYNNKFYPIMANSAHDMTVGWSPGVPVSVGVDPSPAPSIGTTLSIHRLKTRIYSATKYLIIGGARGLPVIKRIWFDGTLGSSLTAMYIHSHLELRECRVNNHFYALFGLHADRIMLTRNLLQNCSGGLHTRDTPIVFFDNTVAISISHCYEIRSSNVLIENFHHFRSCSDLWFPVWYTDIVDIRVRFNLIGGANNFLVCGNNGTVRYTAYNAGGGILENGSQPGYWFNVSHQSSVRLPTSWTAASVVPLQTFTIDGVSFSLTDLDNAPDKRIVGKLGTQVYKI